MKRKPTTKYHLLCAACEARGNTKIESPARYAIYTADFVLATGERRRPEVAKNVRYFVGLSGSLRLGPTRKESAPLSDPLKQYLITVGQAYLADCPLPEVPDHLKLPTRRPAAAVRP